MSIASRVDRGTGSSDLRRLKWIGVALPVVFLVALEMLHLSVLDPLFGDEGGHVWATALGITGAVAFAFSMFVFIERAQRQLARQNRELTAVNAVSTAVQGELAVDEIIDAALQSVLDSTSAAEASVTVFPPEGHGADEGTLRRLVVAGRRPAAVDGAAPVPPLLDIPLSTGTTVVGRLRLRLAEGTGEPDLLASATLQNIGHQLACAIEMGQLIGDLQRRKREGHGIYDVLLQISNQHPLTEILAAVVRHARELLASDEAVVCLNEATTRSVPLQAPSGGTVRVAAGALCIVGEADAAGNGGWPACPVRTDPTLHAILEMPLPSSEGALGDLWIGRRDERPYSGRDGGYLRTLAGLAAIAVTSARMREHERQGAILEERERIAREMHDSLAQVLGVTHLRLRAIGARGEVRAAPAVERELAELADLAQEAYRDVREAILGLRESSRVDRGLIAGLAAYLEKYSAQAGIRATLETAGAAEARLSPRLEVEVIRVIQEALTNVRKHAGASSVVVRIASEEAATMIVIEDDGRGFDLTATLLGRDGYGLHTMRERMELIGGSLTIESRPGHGTRVVATIPHGGGTVSAVDPASADSAATTAVT